MKAKTALIVGATGLIGSELLQYLLAAKEYARVIVLVRRPLHKNHPKLIEQQVDFEQLEAGKELFAVDDVFCCLGTTIKKAKSQEAMYRVDVHYPLTIAKLAKEQGAKQFLVISSLHAKANSAVWYSKMKGTLEQELMKIPFETLAILQPSLLLGKRAEFRLGETVAAFISKGLAFLFVGPLRRYKAIEGKTVAFAMYKIAQTQQKGVTYYPSEKLASIAKE